MKHLLLFALVFDITTSFAQSKNLPAQVERWGRYEITLKGPSEGNPFADQWVKAEFQQGARRFTVNGFYDGDGVYKIRFMPDATGEWTYTTKSNHKALRGKTGAFVCTASGAGHGPVVVAGTWHFKYADGTRYYPFGTTLYAW